MRRGQRVLHVLRVGAVPGRRARAAVDPGEAVILGGGGSGLLRRAVIANLSHGPVGEQYELGRSPELRTVAVVLRRFGSVVGDWRRLVRRRRLRLVGIRRLGRPAGGRVEAGIVPPPAQHQGSRVTLTLVRRRRARRGREEGIVARGGDDRRRVRSLVRSGESPRELLLERARLVLVRVRLGDDRDVGVRVGAVRIGSLLRLGLALAFLPGLLHDGRVDGRVRLLPGRVGRGGRSHELLLAPQREGVLERVDARFDFLPVLLQASLGLLAPFLGVGDHGELVAIQPETRLGTGEIFGLERQLDLALVGARRVLVVVGSLAAHVGGV